MPILEPSCGNSVTGEWFIEPKSTFIYPQDTRLPLRWDCRCGKMFRVSKCDKSRFLCRSRRNILEIKVTNLIICLFCKTYYFWIVRWSSTSASCKADWSLPNRELVEAFSCHLQIWAKWRYSSRWWGYWLSCCCCCWRSATSWVCGRGAWPGYCPAVRRRSASLARWATTTPTGTW